MRSIFTSVLILLAVMSGCSTAQKGRPANVTQATAVDDTSGHFIDFRDATTWVLGDFNPDRLYDPPHGEWFTRGINEFQPDPSVMTEIMKLDTTGLRITVVMGTWCPDSRREVPRFFKIIELWGFPKNKIRMIGVDIDKIAPLDDFSFLDIHRVPTFIFYKNNIEAGRIIENPVTSLEQDMVKILKEK